MRPHIQSQIESTDFAYIAKTTTFNAGRKDLGIGSIDLTTPATGGA
jgi:hypothetical protein